MEKSKEVPVVLVRDKNYYVWVIEECPYCARRHIHGAAEFRDSEKTIRKSLGERATHCIITNQFGYYLVWDGTRKSYSQLRKENAKKVRDMERIAKSIPLPVYKYFLNKYGDWIEKNNKSPKRKDVENIAVMRYSEYEGKECMMYSGTNYTVNAHSIEQAKQFVRDRVFKGKDDKVGIIYECETSWYHLNNCVD